MLVSQKCQYALRAIFELSRRWGQGPTKIAQIAEAQAIPLRFLEVILNQLKQGGFVTSHRGSEGGYRLIRSPGEVTVGQIITFIQGPVGPIGYLPRRSSKRRLVGDCAFYSMWEKVHKAISDVYDGTTFQDLVDEEERSAGRYVPSYSI